MNMVHGRGQHQAPDQAPRGWGGTAPPRGWPARGAVAARNVSRGEAPERGYRAPRIVTVRAFVLQVRLDPAELAALDAGAAAQATGLAGRALLRGQPGT